MPKINILLIENQPQVKSEIYSVLDAEIFNICYLEDIHSPRNKDSCINPELIICRIIGASIDDDIINKLNLINSDNDIPVLFINPIYSSEIYLDRLSCGLFLHINTPFKKDFLYHKIFSILNKYLKCPDGFCGIDFEYFGKRKNIALTNKNMCEFFISSVENSAHQNEILIDTLSKHDPVLSRAVVIDAGEVDRTKHILEYDVLHALENDEFIMYYQPVFSLSDNVLRGFESLIRWQHPERGFLVPDQFIGIIENSPLIIPVGYMIIEKAAHQLKKWQNKYNKDIKLSLNLSTKQFLTRELCEKITDIADNAGVNHEDLSFEITETAFAEDIKTANIILLTLKSKKFRLYMDDFGTGYSSLTYLLHFPVDSIKIDKSFVQWMNIDEQSEQIVKSVIYLGHNLGMTVIAEGVETEEHMEKLRSFGCDYGQGYYYAKPLPPEEAEEFIKKYNRKS